MLRGRILKISIAIIAVVMIVLVMWAVFAMRPARDLLGDRITSDAAVTLRGVDLSHWNKGADLEKLSTSKDFVIAKVGGSDWRDSKGKATQYLDSTYALLASGARANGLKLGHYWFNGQGDPAADAKYFVNHLVDYRAGDPLVLDDETYSYYSEQTRQSTPDAAWTQSQAMQFYRGVVSALRARYPDDIDRSTPNLYIYLTEKQVLFGKWDTVSKNARLWVASWNSNDTTYAKAREPGANYWRTWTIWQYSSIGHPAGLEAHYADLNLARKNAWTTPTLPSAFK